ncbi:aminotransferase class I/II-fold pyridoxal phosphate-dependent enzyme [Bacteroidota bacterium]
MNSTENYNGGENFDLRKLFAKCRRDNLENKVNYFNSFIKNLLDNREMQHLRCITSAADREVEVEDTYTKERKKMLMFGSNNYLGLANHPYVRRKTEEAIQTFGVGIGGPPLLNGYTVLHRRLEERLASLKKKEDALIFSSGYGANVGLVTALMNKNSIVFNDAYSHASFMDGIKMSGVNSLQFEHNNVHQLNEMLNSQLTKNSTDVFVGVEGVYSMDGDTAPLDKIVECCRKYDALLIVDDAHGTGSMGERGSGTAEHYGVEDQVDITMGTFSKTFAVAGGFITASKPIINFLRFFARSYMFSASLPPTVIAAVLAGLDVIEQEKDLLKSFRDNINYVKAGLRNLGFEINTQSGIISLRTPMGMNVRKAAYEFHKRGIFLNSIEYPAVPVSQQRFRISIMATHTKADIDRLLEAIEEVWSIVDITGDSQINQEAA